LDATANTGEAAHISAAAAGRGARRYRSDLTAEQRSSIENGIWCCAFHAKLIDTDEITFTIPMLMKWKALAEHRAQLRHAYGDKAPAHRYELMTVGMAPATLPLISGEDIAEPIGNYVRYSYLAEICGTEEAHSVRDFLIEYVRNALSHGAALNVEISFAANAISVVDDGAEYHVCGLSGPTARGGGRAFRVLCGSQRLGCASSRRVGKENHLHIPIVLSASELPRVNPCAITLSHSDIREGRVSASKYAGCDRVFVIARQFAVYSDGPAYARLVQKLSEDHSNVVLILPDVSAGVVEHYRQLLPKVEIVAWQGA